ncbi:hypothetical protein K0B96_06455 [Horticoccus luteus]|uniref:HTH domain-containing protein n=1 Tax=Horticoccus luteus TaxID=2862869 RepID=A0A8F9TW89_9BACT|nr:hypothetical protein [Horticoccus luteus]QYM80251.1 hypothetical protein K0B96_06455 [Horticoccus luteus]
MTPGERKTYFAVNGWHTATPNQRPAIERMMHIADLLRRGVLFNSTRLTQRFEVARKTVVRDMEFMRDRLRYDFEFDRSANTYRLRNAPPPTL